MPDDLEKQLGHRFDNPDLLATALRHASMGENSNERLEFLGDRVLGLILAEDLYTAFAKESEGGLHARHRELVRRETCARVGEACGLWSHLKMAPGEAKATGRAKVAILADASEAIIGALFLDGGYRVAKCFIDRYWRGEFANLAPELRDAKTALQEWAQSGALPDKVQPVYTLAGRSGPDHAPTFRVSVAVPGQPAQEGEGPTKRDAEQDGASKMLRRLGLWKE